jgi:hypothetical protein
MVLLAGTKISKRLKFCIGVLILIILLYLVAKFIISKANDCREQFSTELFVSYEDAMKILQKGIMNNKELTQIIQNKLAVSGKTNIEKIYTNSKSHLEKHLASCNLHKIKEVVEVVVPEPTPTPVAVTPVVTSGGMSLSVRNRK